MIVKMKFFSITGPKTDIDRVTNTYLSKYETHLENAISELKSVQNLTPYIEINPYREALTTANAFYDKLEHPEKIVPRIMTLDDSLHFIDDLKQKYEALQSKRLELAAQRDKIKESLNIIQPFRELDYDISSILKFQFIRFRFGRIEKSYFEKFDQFLYHNLDTVFYRCHEDAQYLWGVYFAPKKQVKQVDAVFSSMHFERVFVPDEYSGTPETAFQRLEDRYKLLVHTISSIEQELASIYTENAQDIVSAREEIDTLSSSFDVRKVAACTIGTKETFYILCGWMSEKDTRKFQKDISKDANLFCIVEDEEHKLYHQPPTKLKNPRVMRPFEMFVRMYGLPAYNEMDPTWLVAITYALIFGAMFGDAGQGICLIIGGFLLYKFKKADLAAIIGTAGIFSTFFGFMFGSFFGFEDIIEPIWLRPVTAMSNLPFIGKLNTVFVVAIAFGMFLIILSIIIHIINAIRAKDIENIFFDTNAIAGFVFYGSFVAVIVLFMTGNNLPGTLVLCIMFILPLLVMFFKEPLTHLCTKSDHIFPKEKGMFFVQGFFELFELLLSYFSNTLSFVRIGAFAVSHAAIMEVVLQLSGAEQGTPNFLVIIIGNLVVIGLEGLIVGIQVLRLEYYELFSRFYKGTGKAFKPFLYKKSK
ncbi:MAG: V-type ATP synthase subunit I [Lachnospiraceae bacterium]